jgi:hypothetical protein
MISLCAIYTFIIGVIYPNYSANCSGFFKHIAGTATAIRGVVTMVGASMIIGIIGLIHINGIPGFLLVYCVLAAIALFIFLVKINPNNVGDK